MLNTCTEFAASHNLLFNASKTKCMYFDIIVPDRKHMALLNSDNHVMTRTGVFIRFESIRIDSRRCLIKSIHSVRIDSEVLR